MIDVNAALGTRAPLGVGVFAYPACALSVPVLRACPELTLNSAAAPALSSVRTPLSSVGPLAPARIAHGLTLSGRSLSLLDCSVFSRRARSIAGFFTQPAPVFQQDAPAISILCRREAWHNFKGGSPSFDVTSRSTSLLPWSACTPTQLAAADVLTARGNSVVAASISAAGDLSAFRSAPLDFFPADFSLSAGRGEFFRLGSGPFFSCRAEFGHGQAVITVSAEFGSAVSLHVARRRDARAGRFSAVSFRSHHAPVRRALRL